MDSKDAVSKNTPSMHHPQRQNVSTSMAELGNGHIHKHLTPNGEPQRYSWGRKKNGEPQRYSWGRKERKKNGEPQRYSWEGRRGRMVNPRDIAGKAEEEEW